LILYYFPQMILYYFPQMILYYFPQMIPHAIDYLKQKVFGGVGTFFQKGSDPPEAFFLYWFFSFRHFQEWGYLGALVDVDHAFVVGFGEDAEEAAAVVGAEDKDAPYGTEAVIVLFS